MWQRIQTLYLALSLALTAVLLFGTAFTVNGTEGIETVKYAALRSPYMLILLILLAAGTLLALITFKVRILQMRLSVLMGLVALGLQVWLGVMYFTAPEGVVFKWTAILPLAVALLDFLAARGAFQDQLMVETASRLRASRRDRRGARK